jgi:hypothetical protein
MSILSLMVIRAAKVAESGHHQEGGLGTLLTLDGPNLTNDRPNGHKAAEARVAPDSGAKPAPNRAIQFRTANAIAPPVESAPIRAQLI